MGEPVVQSAEPQSAALQAAVQAFGASEDEARAVEPALRDARRHLAKAFLPLDDAPARARFEGDAGEPVRLLVHCGLRDLVRDEEDEALAVDVLRRMDAGPATGALLAGMLMFQAFELPVPPDLGAIPVWLLPDYTRFLLSMPRVFNRPGDADRYLAFFDAAMERIHRYATHEPERPLAGQVRDLFLSESRFLQAYFNEGNLKAIYRRRAELVEGWALSRGVHLAHTFALRPPSPQRRLRVGILSQHFGPQTETYFMLAHFERFPRDRCALFLYAMDDQEVPLSHYARSIADATVDLPKDNLAMAADRIRADDLDLLLVGTNVTVTTSNLGFLAGYRLARVQVTSASSPVTSGMTAADWYLNAEENETADAQGEYTEQLYRMPGMLTRYAYHLDSDPRTVTLDRGDLGIPKNAVLFFSASNFFKVIPELSALWARILAQLPEARLLLMPFNTNWSFNYLSQPLTERVLRQVEEAGADPDKVHIVDALPTRADLHGVMALADVYLDSYPFAGACSLLDPLLVGLPVVARTGRNFRGGVGAGMLRGLGLGDMATPDEESYLRRAVALARDPQLRKRERARIQAAISPTNPVFDSETGSRNMEAAFVDMVARADALDAALLRLPAAHLQAAIRRLEGDLAGAANQWFRALNDLELIRQLVVPYFQSLPGEGLVRRMVDVGACVGQTAEPFLAMGWHAELFEPDPACGASLAALAGHFGGRAAVHRAVVSDAGATSVTFYQSATGLSGLSPSPYGATEATLELPAVRLADHLRAQRIEHVDFLKIDTEGWDFDALRSHDFAAAPPRLVMVEFGTDFPRQPMEAVMQGIAEMAQQGYEALVFSYEDDGNFKNQVWRYRLIGARFGAPVKRKDGQAGGNILFFRRDDSTFLAVVLKALLHYLPACERQRHLDPLK